MGIFFGANKPPEKFVGLWTNGDTVRMRIWKSGTINYFKEVEGGSLKMTTSPHYDEDGFQSSLICPSWGLLDGIYDGRIPHRPIFIVNNDKLTKQLVSNRGMQIPPIFTTSS